MRSCAPLLADHSLNAMQVRTPTAMESHRLQTSIALMHFTQAEALARRLTVRYPGNFMGWNGLGVVLGATGRFSESLPALERAALLAPKNPDVLCNLGLAHMHATEWQKAEDCFRRAARLDHVTVRAFNFLASLLGMRGRLDEAEAIYRQALSRGGEDADILNNLGLALRSLDRLDEAEVCLRRAVAARPGFSKALQTLGGTLLLNGRIGEAEEALRAALTAEPRHHAARSDLLFCLNYRQHTPQEYLTQARRYGDEVSRARSFCFSDWQCPAGDLPLRVGFVSGDLRSHPVAHFLRPLLDHLDPSTIRPFGYSTVAQEDATTQELKAAFANWTQIHNLGDEAAARKIHADGIHVLIDLSGHTAMNRLPVFAYRPAPLQLTWLGYFASTGVGEIDYLIADPVSVPVEHFDHFTERIWHLPQTRLCFSAPDIDLHVNRLPALDQGHVTFCCFNNLAKLNDEVLALWSEVLASVDGSRLLLKARQLAEDAPRRRLVERIIAAGMDPRRVTLEGPSPHNEYLATFHRADIALDPFPFSGGTTTAESLWMGVPVVTLNGDRLIARQGAGLLSAVGLPDWIAANPRNYVEIAVRAARDIQALTDLRAGLRDRVRQSPLFDAPGFSTAFVAALISMWEMQGAHPVPPVPGARS